MIGSGTRFGVVALQMRNFIDQAGGGRRRPNWPARLQGGQVARIAARLKAGAVRQLSPSMVPAEGSGVADQDSDLAGAAAGGAGALLEPATPLAPAADVLARLRRIRRHLVAGFLVVVPHSRLPL
jgi:hypothetical protein